MLPPLLAPYPSHPHPLNLLFLRETARTPLCFLSNTSIHSIRLRRGVRMRMIYNLPQTCRFALPPWVSGCLYCCIQFRAVSPVSPAGHGRIHLVPGRCAVPISNGPKGRTPPANGGYTTRGVATHCVRSVTPCSGGTP